MIRPPRRRRLALAGALVCGAVALAGVASAQPDVPGQAAPTTPVPVPAQAAPALGQAAPAPVQAAPTPAPPAEPAPLPDPNFQPIVPPSTGQPLPPPEPGSVMRRVEVLSHKPSGFWTSNRPAKGARYRWRIMAAGGVVLAISIFFLARMLRRVNRERALGEATRTS